MKRNQTHKMFLVAFTFAAALIAARPAAAQDPKQPYPTMAGRTISNGPRRRNRPGPQRST